ncbi:putative cell division cycle protein 20 -like B-like [Scophthalmus maximus]|uniref:Putative cell division cycle protein 20-like B-like n=1 Tax=Scophthalmus maximus TaxID=52904 RepID=A0A2U9BTK5_SCOMX|nr:putative cell division cycle protein 20 -like B-like [Scophthalmus maximus]
MIVSWQSSGSQYLSVAGSDERSRGLQPFAVLDEAPVSLQGKSVMKLAAPSLLNDYYTSVLDCSCNGLVALALGSSVYLWNSETRALVGHLDPGPQTGRPRHRSVSSLCWSRDGTALCVGTRRGEIQTGGICSLQWSPGDDWLASGSADGLLRIWDSDIAGLTRSKQPVTTMKQPSAVKCLFLNVTYTLVYGERYLTPMYA